MRQNVEQSHNQDIMHEIELKFYIKKNGSRNLFYHYLVSLVLFSQSTNSSPKAIDNHACCFMSYRSNFLFLLFESSGGLFVKFCLSDLINKCVCVCLFFSFYVLLINLTLKLHKE